ncbi:hypothetical protein ScPMuIL_009823 [Solemya velum]
MWGDGSIGCEGDIVGHFLALFSLLPFCIIVSFCTLIIFRRDLHTISYFGGLMLNEVLNWILKHIIRESRPTARAVLYTEYGMPSSHAQFVWFFATYMLLFLFIRIYTNYNWIDDLWKYCVGFGGYLAAVIVTYSRVYLGYHTFNQVFCGALLGTIFGGSWFCVVQLLLTPMFPFLAASPLGEFFMFRDSTLIPHVMWFEYTSSRAEARSRQRKITARKSQ